MQTILRYSFIIMFSFLGVSLSGCASTPHTVRTSAPNISQDVYDPLEDVNRNINKFNEGVDKYLVGPLASLYKTILPKPVRMGVSNVARNLEEPVTFANDVLQLDFEDASETVGRFMLNSTVGIGGLVDVAGQARPTPPPEDFGQTLATYNIPQGPYLVLPFLGPSNARDLVGRVGGTVLSPFTWSQFAGEGELRAGTGATSLLDVRINAEPFLENIRSSADPYVNLRGLYTQRRLSNIHEDADPFDTPSDFDDDFDDIDDGFADFD